MFKYKLMFLSMGYLHRLDNSPNMNLMWYATRNVTNLYKKRNLRCYVDEKEIPLLKKIVLFHHNVTDRATIPLHLNLALQQLHR